MKKESLIPIGIALIFCSLWLRECNVNRNLEDTINSIREEENKETDTIISDKPFIEPDPLPIQSKPDKVIIYPKDTANYPYKEIVFIKDTIRLYNNELDKFDIHSDFLLQYPEAPKLVSFELSKEYLELSLLEKSGSIIGKGYILDLDNRKYAFQGNKLTSAILPQTSFIRKPPTLYLNAHYEYRPLPNFHDFNLDFNIETKRFIYTLGINGYIYPNNQGLTPRLGISYKIPF